MKVLSEQAIKILSKKAPAASAVEFRDAYYARLNDRVDDWMEKVNNMSLQDINRYQFRRDRPSNPAFPFKEQEEALLKILTEKHSFKEVGCLRITKLVYLKEIKSIGWDQEKLNLQSPQVHRMWAVKRKPFQPNEVQQACKKLQDKLKAYPWSQNYSSASGQARVIHACHYWWDYYYSTFKFISWTASSVG